MRIILLGDGLWATRSMRFLTSAGHEVSVIVLRRSPSDNSLEVAAAELNIPTLQPLDINTSDIVQKLRSFKADVVLCVSFAQILHSDIIHLARLGTVNFHGGKLPLYRGRSVLNWAIINGETEIGLTAHYVDEGIDTGDILLQKTLPIAWTDTYDDVLKRLVAAFPEFVSEVVSLLVHDKAERRSQADLNGTYFPRRRPGDEWIEWGDTSRNIHNKIRAITRPGPGARTHIGDQVITLWRAFYDEAWPDYLATPGQVVGVKRGEGVMIKTGDSTLLVEEVQVGDDDPRVPRWQIGTKMESHEQNQIRQLKSRVDMLEQMLKQLEAR